MIWDKRNPVAGALGVATQHEYVIWRTMKETRFFVSKPNAEAILRKAEALIKGGKVNDQIRKEFKNWIRKRGEFSVGERSYCGIEDTRRVYQSVHMGAPEPRDDEKFYVPLNHPATGKPCPVPQNGWSGTPEFMQDLIKEGRILFGKDEKVQPRRKYYLDESMNEPVSSVLGHGGRGKADLDKLGLDFPYSHPVALYEYCIGAATNGSDVVLDFFGGSGTTAHAVLNLNRADGGSRKFVLVEAGEHFDSVLLQRVKKILFSPAWSEGKPKQSAADSQNRGGAFMYCEMEQYEDTLRGMSYKGSSPVLVDGRRGIGGQYVFLSDEKLSGVASLSGGDLSLDLGRLPSGLSLAETLANARGSFLRKFEGGRAILSDGSEWKLNAGEMTEEEKTDFLRVLRPYLWWGE